MKRLIHFFSLAVLTQLTLMLSQLILLPIQVRLWGQRETAIWYSALALATATYVVDCGLRTAGHAELMRAQRNGFRPSDETATFRQIWSWIRILVLAVTASLVAADAAIHLLKHTSFPTWRAVLICACALETVLTIRITYLDSLGHYRGAEASYLCFAVLRLGLAVPALYVLHWKADGLAGIYLFTAAMVLWGQGHWLCRTIPLLRLHDKLPALSLATLALARHTVAEPAANWARLSLPVLVIGQIASPIAVTTYVALRAVFGAGRTTIQQLARVASVECLKLKHRSEEDRSQSLLTVFLVAAVLFGSALGMFVLADNMRLLGLWLRHFDHAIFLEVALAFALTSPFFSYQIPMNLMFRTGHLAWVAKRHYGFIAYSASIAGSALVATSFPVYLGCLVSAELLLSVTFLLPGGERKGRGDRHAGRSGLLTASGSFVLILGCWMAVRHNLLGVFDSAGIWKILLSYSIAMMAVGGFALLVCLQNRDDFNAIRNRRKTNHPSFAVAE